MFTVQNTGTDTNTITSTITILQKGRYHYSIVQPTRGVNYSTTIVIAGASIDVSSSKAEGDIELNANDQCVMSITANAYFAGITVLLYKL